jgi:hypothetical protein
LTRTFPGLLLSRRLLLALLLVPLLAWAQGGELYGRVQTIGSDGQPLFLVGAQVTLTSKTDPNRRFETKTDESGAYRFRRCRRATTSPPSWSYDESKQDITVEDGVLQETTLTLPSGRCSSRSK